MSRSTDEVLSLNEGVPKKVYFGIFDVVRGILILMVVLYHYQQAFLGNGFLIQPDGIMANFQRLQISQGGGFIDIFKNIFTSLFAYGFSAVNVFLLLSGFVLTWSGLQDAGKAMERKEKAKIYIFKKMRRILIPFYISILVTFVLMLIRNYFFPAIAWWPPYTWFDYTKFLLVPYLFFDLDLLQMLNGDYWYITIILQFYLIFPVLFWLLQRFGLKKFLLSISLLTFGYRFFATFGYELLLPWIRISFLDTAPMGVLTSAQNSYEGFCFFLPRLAEFGLGMAIAWFQFYKKDFLATLGKISWFFVGWGTTLFGFVLNMYRPGWIFSDFFIAVGLFVFLTSASTFLIKIGFLEKFFVFLGKYSYEIYLLHHNFLNMLLLPIFTTFGILNERFFWFFLIPYFVMIIVIGFLGGHLTKFTHNLEKILVLRFSRL